MEQWLQVVLDWPTTAQHVSRWAARSRAGVLALHEGCVGRGDSRQVTPPRYYRRPALLLNCMHKLMREQSAARAALTVPVGAKDDVLADGRMRALPRIALIRRPPSPYERAHC